jgi:hypothetical protein
LPERLDEVGNVLEVDSKDKGRAAVGCGQFQELDVQEWEAVELPACSAVNSRTYLRDGDMSAR